MREIDRKLINSVKKSYYTGTLEAIKAGADINATDIGEPNSLMLALINNDLAIAKLLLDNGIDVNYNKDKHYGGTALICAIELNDMTMMKLLLKYGTDINMKGRLGWTPLMMAAYFDRKDMVELLISHGADLDIVDKQGFSAFSLAVIYDSAAVVETMIAHGVSLTGAAFGTSDKDALALATEHRSYKSLELIRSHMLEQKLKNLM